MPVRLQGGLETYSYWQEVRECGNDLLRAEGLNGWTITIEPLTAEICERAGVSADDDDSNGIAQSFDIAAKELKFAVSSGTHEDDHEPHNLAQLLILENIIRLTEIDEVGLVGDEHDDDGEMI